MVRTVVAGIAAGIVISGAIVGVMVPMTAAVWHSPVMVWGVTAAVVGLSVVVAVRVTRARRE